MLSNIIVIRSYVLIAILHDLSERSKFSLVNSDLECTIFTDVVMISFHLKYSIALPPLFVCRFVVSYVYQIFIFCYTVFCFSKCEIVPSHEELNLYLETTVGYDIHL